MNNSLKVAYCTDISEFHFNGFKNQRILAKMPGSFWLYLLLNKLKSEEIELVSGDIALIKITKKEWNPKEIFVIQEQKSFQGYQLIKLGSNPLIILCLESPLYAYRFYDNVFSIANKFYYRIFFSGVFDKTNFSFGKNIILEFPNSFSNINYNFNWKDRKDAIVLVASNKIILNKLSINFSLRGGIRQIYYNILEILSFYLSNNRRNAKRNQLLKKRQDFIEILSDHFKIDIYGSNWDNFLNKVYRKSNLFLKGNCNDKVKVMSKYKFAICFENTRYNGYVTEKIIDCFISGVIPIYFGAPDINLHIPPDCYIDFDKFSSYNDVCLFIRNIDEKTANVYISNGKKFIEMKKQYSHKHFADKIYNYITEHINING